MANPKILDILTDAHPMMRQTSEPVGEVTDEIRAFAYDMIATMVAARGIGLAAVQVGRPIRMLVIETGTSENRKPLVMVDPVIDWAKKREIGMEEGCLSIPNRRVDVSRPSDVDVVFTGLDDVRTKRSLGGMPARIVQHEIDHLDGVLMTDRAA